MRIPRNAILSPHSIFHKMWRTHNKAYLLQPHAEKRSYLACIQEDQRQRCRAEDFVLHGYCIMSNHAHETGQLGDLLKPFSDHMRRAHGRFGLEFNQRNERQGAVAYDRPKTRMVQDQQALRRCMFYSDCNPVRAGLIPHPTDIRWKGLSSCRFYAYGEKNDFSAMLTVPAWYLALGETPEQRQSRYRALLDQYLVEQGKKRDPRLGSGHFDGEESWVEGKRGELSQWLKNHRRAPPSEALPPG